MNRRGGGGDRPAVEFLDSGPAPAPAEPGEEITARPARRNPRWYLVLSALVLAAVALLAGKVSGGDQHPFTSPSKPAGTTSTQNVPDSILDPEQCPGPTPCVATAGVPAPVAAAVLDAFPSARLGPGSTVYLAVGGLWFREITARAGPLAVLVRIERPSAGAPVTQSSQGDGVTFVRQLEHGFLVQVQVEGPRDQLPSISNLYGLAEDARLVGPG